ncbi:MAG: DUF5320 domain-containing protein [Pirellulales bacterium]|nr:DUF5320 domain-containing protein [Pirellulales bacterium]
MGMGPMTGRAAGYCAGYPVPGFVNSPGGRGFGGRGFGRGGYGRRNQFYATGLTGWQRAAAQPPLGPYYAPPAAPPLNAEQEVAMLKQQADSLSNSLEQIKQRLEELQGATQPASKQ